MKYIVAFLCITCALMFGLVSTEDGKARLSEQVESVPKDKVEDLEGSETSAKLFNLGSLFPSYGTNPAYRPGGYPTTGSGYYPSTGSGYYPSTGSGYYPSTGNGYYPSYTPTQGYNPTSGYYPTGTNVLGNGFGGYPTQSYYPSVGYSRTSGYNTKNSGYDSSYNGYGGSVRGSSGISGYGGYGGNGGIKSYYGYYNPQYSGKRNLGYGYYSDTDRYGFYQSPSQQLSVNRGYD